jgi:hypothetical protein
VSLRAKIIRGKMQRWMEDAMEAESHETAAMGGAGQRHQRRLDSARSALNRRLQLEREVRLGPQDALSWFPDLMTDIESIASDAQEHVVRMLGEDPGFGPGAVTLLSQQTEGEIGRCKYSAVEEAKRMRDERLHAASSDPNHLRLLVLRAVSALAGGDLSVLVDTDEIVEQVGLPFGDTRVALLDLVGGGWVTAMWATSATMAPVAVQLTYAGKVATERGALGETPMPPITFNFTHSQIASLNLGQVVGNVQAVVGQLWSGGQQELADALKALTEAIINEQSLDATAKGEAVELVSSISEEIAKPPQERRMSVLRAGGSALATALAQAPKVFAAYQIVRTLAKQAGYELP